MPPCSPCAAKAAARAAAAVNQLQRTDIGWAQLDGAPKDHSNPVVIDDDGVLALVLVRSVPNVWPSRTPEQMRTAFNDPPNQLVVGSKFVAKVNRKTRSHPFVNSYFWWIAEVNSDGEIVENWHGATVEMITDQRVAVHPGWVS